MPRILARHADRKAVDRIKETDRIRRHHRNDVRRSTASANACDRMNERAEEIENTLFELDISSLDLPLSVRKNLTAMREQIGDLLSSLRYELDDLSDMAQEAAETALSMDLHLPPVKKGRKRR